jgi:hypothetical protein
MHRRPMNHSMKILLDGGLTKGVDLYNQESFSHTE